MMAHASSAPADDPPRARATRLLAPGLDAALEQFANPEVLAAGKVNVITLDAVVERFGGKWSLRREHVHDHVEGLLDRVLGSQGYHLRISDTDVLVCQPDLGALAGQASCLRILRDILGHFLGEGGLADIGVHEVLSVSSTGVEARRVDARAAYAAAARADQDRKPKADKADRGPDIGAADMWTPFVASNGRSVTVACTLDPLREMRGPTRIGLRMVRRVTDSGTGRAFTAAELALFSRSDRLRIDLGGIVQGLNALRSDASAAQPLTLVIPVSFSSLSNLEGRARIASAFQEARSHTNQGVICELREIDGVPAAPLLAAAAMIRPFSLFVIGHATDLTRAEARVLKEAGLRGVSLECPPNLGEASFLTWAKSAVATAKIAARSVLVYGVPSERQSRILAALGATHTTVIHS